MLEYGWIFVTAILTLLSGYLTILNIREKKDQPFDDLISQFTTLDKTVSSLNNTISNLNEKVLDYIVHSNKMHDDIKADLKKTDSRINDHETRITVLEREKDFDDNFINHITK